MMVPNYIRKIFNFITSTKYKKFITILINMNYLILILTISILILLVYCVNCFFSENFENEFQDRAGKIDYLLSDTKYHNISNRVRQSIDEISGIPTNQDMKKALKSMNPITTGADDIYIPKDNNPVADANKNCKRITSCGFYSSSDYQNCTSCVDNHNGSINNAFFNANIPFSANTNDNSQINEINDCPCKVNNFAECKNVQKIIQCEKIRNPYSTVDSEDCGFVFFAQGAKHNYDTGVALSKTSNINFIKAPDTCTSLNKQDNYQNGVIMPNPRYMNVEGNNLSEKIKNWIAQHEELIYDEYTDHCSPALNNNGNDITRDCATIKFMTAGTERGKDYPPTIGYKQHLQRIDVKSVDDYDIYLRELKEGLDSTGEALIKSQEALLGIIACKNADDIAINANNADFMWKCYKQAYPEKMCNTNPSHDIYPTNLEKTLKLYSGVPLKTYKTQMDNLVSTVLQGYSNPDSTTTEIVRDAYKKCTGKTYNLDYLNVGQKGAYQPGFDVMVFKITDKNKEKHGSNSPVFDTYHVTNHVVLPNLNIDTAHAREILGTAMDSEGRIGSKQYTDIRCHVQGVLHFSKPGNYYFRVLTDDGAVFRVDNGTDIVSVIPEEAFRPQLSTPYYGVLKNIKSNKVMPYNIIWGQEYGSISLKVSYHYAGNKTYSRSQLQAFEKNTNDFWKLINDDGYPTRRYPPLRALRAPYFNNVYKIDIGIGSYYGQLAIGNLKFFGEKNKKLIPSINPSSITQTYYSIDGSRTRFPKSRCENYAHKGGLFNGLGRSENIHGGLCKNNGSILSTRTPQNTIRTVDGTTYTTFENLPNNLFNTSNIYNITGRHSISFELNKPLSIHKASLSGKPTTAHDKSEINYKYSMNGKNYIQLISAYNVNETKNTSSKNLRFFLPLMYANQSSNNISYHFKMYPVKNNRYFSYMM
jgi:hypothetical protein